MSKQLLSVAVVFGLASAAWAGKYNPTMEIGQAAPSWSELPTAMGKTSSLNDFADKELVVVAFSCNSCPYAVDYEDRIIDFCKKHCGRDGKVGFVMINVNKAKDDLLPAMKKRATEKKFSFPYSFDESQKIAKDFGATRTPEFFVLDKDRKVAYMGAMDDSPDSKKVKQRYLEDAVTSLLSGGKPGVTETVAIGCNVRYERRRRSRRKNAQR